MADWLEEYHGWLELAETFTRPIREKIREESWFRKVFVAEPAKKDQPSAAPPKVRKRPRG
jgi:hypothetical protein